MKLVLSSSFRIGYWGVSLGLGQGNTMACPVILRFGTEEQKVFYLAKVVTGEIRFCYAITEPDGIYSINFTLVSARDGKALGLYSRFRCFYVVDGIKRWVTNGIFSQFCIATVLTAGPGRGDIARDNPTQ